MDALIIANPRELKVASVDEPQQKLGPNEVLVEVMYVSLCGSDYALYSGTYSGPCAYPIRFGHEWSGTVVSKGSNATLAVGDSVTGDCSIWCGQCLNCRSDKNLCTRIEKYGITRDGFSQKRVVVPQQYLHVNDLGIPLEILALSELFAVALHAIHRWSRQPQEPTTGPTLIIGGGCLGMAVYLLLKYHFRWQKIEICERSDEKRQFLRERFPFVQIGTSLNGSKGYNRNDYHSVYRHAVYPLIFETASSASALKTALSCCAVNGTIVALGFHPLMDSFDSMPIVLKSLSMVGSIGGSGEFEETMAFLSRNVNTVRPLITASFDYTEAEQAFRQGAHKGSQLKVQIHFTK